MKLKAKIKKEYLNEILSGKKKKEYRQFESIELVDENGRVAEYDIVDVYPLSEYTTIQVENAHPDVPWIPRKRIVKLTLGERLR